MRILYVSGYSRMILFNKLIPDAIRKNGYDVTEFNWNNIYGWNKTVRLLSGKTVENKINKVLLETAEKVKPDMIFILKGEPVFPSTLLKLKKMTGAVLFNFFGDDPWEFSSFSGKRAPFYDLFFTYDPWSVKLYTQSGYNHAYHLPYGYDNNAAQNVVVTDKERKKYSCDVAFIGSYYDKRDEMLSRLSAKFNIKIWGRGWKNSQSRDIFQGHALYGYEMLKAMKCCKILLNIHRGFEEGTEESGEGLNLRVMEGTACGAFQLTNLQNDLPERFIPGKEIEIYTTQNEASEKIDYYLANETKRKEIAANGYQKLVQKHTLEQRMNEMLNIVRENL